MRELCGADFTAGLCSIFPWLYLLLLLFLLFNSLIFLLVIIILIFILVVMLVYSLILLFDMWIILVEGGCRTWKGKVRVVGLS